MTDIDEKIKEAEKLLKEGKTIEFEKLLSELFLERKLTKEQGDRIDKIFARSRGVELSKEKK